MEIKKAQFRNEDERLPTVFTYEIESGYIYFSEYRTNGSELILRFGKTEVAIIRTRGKELEVFKKLFNEARKK